MNDENGMSGVTATDGNDASSGTASHGGHTLPMHGEAGGGCCASGAATEERPAHADGGSACSDESKAEPREWTAVEKAKLAAAEDAANGYAKRVAELEGLLEKATEERDEARAHLLETERALGQSSKTADGVVGEIDALAKRIDEVQTKLYGYIDDAMGGLVKTLKPSITDIAKAVGKVAAASEDGKQTAKTTAAILKKLEGIEAKLGPDGPTQKALGTLSTKVKEVAARLPKTAATRGAGPKRSPDPIKTKKSS